MQLEKSNTTDKGCVFEINKALIVLCKMLDKRHSGAKKITGMLKIFPVSGELMDQTLK